MGVAMRYGTRNLAGNVNTDPGVTALTPTVERTSGVSSFDSGQAWQSGRTVFVKLVFKSGNSSVSTGSNTFVGKLSGVPLPPTGAIGLGYLGATVLIGNISDDGTLTIRVAGSNKSASSSNTFGVSWTYITLSQQPGGGSSDGIYTGAYTVTPEPFDSQTLNTRNKQMIDDVTVTKIPTYETSNLSGGTTFYIGSSEAE